MIGLVRPTQFPTHCSNIGGAGVHGCHVNPASVFRYNVVYCDLCCTSSGALPTCVPSTAHEPHQAAACRCWRALRVSCAPPRSLDLPHVACYQALAVSRQAPPAHFPAAARLLAIDTQEGRCGLIAVSFYSSKRWLLIVHDVKLWPSSTATCACTDMRRQRSVPCEQWLRAEAAIIIPHPYGVQATACA